ncbi:histidine phosphatase family protein [Ammoniphilus sp. 3BR4]|uniref:histidine phosphatase family protein n=1 Tax=Ammoniphilus sp. 3BR4 TaxID=3158265 RepID=UPI0034655AE1
MKWIWIRHGETEPNAQRKYLGHLDAPLNDRGKRQAQKTASRLSNLAIHRIYSSDLARCMETARLLGQMLNLVPNAIPSLRELDFGEWDGRTYEQIVQTNRSQVEAWYSNPFDCSPPGGETLHAFGQRVDRWLNRLFQDTSEGETIALVSHGGVIRYFESKWVRGSADKFWDTQGLPHGNYLEATWNGSHWSVHRPNNE